MTVPVLAESREEATKLARAWLLEHGWSAREFQLWPSAEEDHWCRNCGSGRPCLV